MKHIAVKASNAPLLIGITGASGVIYGVRLLELLRACNIETHLIVSRGPDDAYLRDQSEACRR